MDRRYLVEIELNSADFVKRSIEIFVKSEAY